MQEITETEVAVIGAGVLGLATARALARRGRDTVVVEQATVGHERGGSKGRSRIFRTSYDDPLWAALARAARTGWTELERETSTDLFTPTGLLSFGGELDALASAMEGDEEAGVLVLSAAEARDRFPGLEPPGPAVYEAGAGVLSAEGALAALWQSASGETGERPPGQASLLEDCRVLSLSDDGRRVDLALEQGRRLRCKSAVVCAGAFTGPLLATGTFAAAGRMLRPSLQTVAFLVPDSDPGILPAFVDRRGIMPYGLADLGRSAAPAADTSAGAPVATGRYKVGVHRPSATVEPGTVSLVAEPELVEQCVAAARRLWPAWSWSVAAAEACFYDNSPDEDVLLDRSGNVVVAAGTSGHGFKFGPLFGELIADLVTAVPVDGQLAKRFGAARLTG